ncbi:MAG: ABC transporter ATP-binding protein [Bacillota bacterium]|nr:ABC transporter ATP-binding protein [Bacillota bacterium]
MFHFKNAEVCYGKKPVLENIDITVERGMVTAILGPNGCGKSTLLKSAAGQLPLAAGNIFVDGSSIGDMDPIELAGKVAFLPQTRPVPNISAGKLVLHGRFPHLKFPRKYGVRDQEIAAEVMDQLDISPLAPRNMQQLSGGERQKVYLAMALCQQTDAVLMDEPTTYLDIDHQVMLWQRAEQLAQDGKAVLIVTHEITQALRAADRVVVMEKGKVKVFGTPREVLKALEEVFCIKIREQEGYFIAQLPLMGEKGV